MIIEDDLEAIALAANAKKRRLEVDFPAQDGQPPPGHGTGPPEVERDDTMHRLETPSNGGHGGVEPALTALETRDGQHRPEDDLSPTVHFTPQPSVPSEVLFHTPPDPRDGRIVQSADSWARPPRGVYKDAAVFVDVVLSAVTDPFCVGVVGPKDSHFMCVCCGKIDDFMSSSRGYPVCSE